MKKILFVFFMAAFISAAHATIPANNSYTGVPTQVCIPSDSNSNCGGTGTVTNVTASSPLASSGGAAPNITVSSSVGSGAVILQNNPNFTGNVGIGSSSPGQALDVNGTVRALQYIGTGNGVNTFTGNVGIGTSIPNALLDIENGGGLLIGNSSYPSWLGASGIYIAGSMYSGGAFVANDQYDFGVSSIRMFGQSIGNSGDYWYVSTNSIPRLYIDGSGNVGIGSTSPGSTLDVNGTVRGISGGTCTTLYLCQGGVDAGVWQTSACNLCPASTCVAHNGCF